MDINDVRELLPFFVSGTLEPDQRKMVEEALATSEELRMELDFWKRAQQVVAARQAENAAGHLTSRQIVDRALGTLTGEELLSVDNHLRACPSCSEDFNLLVQSLESNRGVLTTWTYRLKTAIRSVRLVYAVPALAVVAVASLLIISYWNKQPAPLPTKEITPPTVAENQQPEEAITSIWLSYRPKMRSASQQDLPVVELGEHGKQIKVFVSIPHNAVRGIRYKLAVISKGRTSYHIQDPVERYASGADYDSLRFVLPREVLALPGNTTILTISEVLPRELQSLTPEEYRLTFAVRAKP